MFAPSVCFHRYLVTKLVVEVVNSAILLVHLRATVSPLGDLSQV